MVYLIAVLHLKPFGLTYLNIVCRKKNEFRGLRVHVLYFSFFFLIGYISE